MANICITNVILRAHSTGLYFPSRRVEYCISAASMSFKFKVEEEIHKRQGLEDGIRRLTF